VAFGRRYVHCDDQKRVALSRFDDERGPQAGLAPRLFMGTFLPGALAAFRVDRGPPFRALLVGF